MSASCPACGTLNPAGVKFCGECGASLTGAGTSGTAGGASEQSPNDAVSRSERRLVTVLFGDLVGFTTIAEGRDPEETRELLTRYFDVSRGIVARYGGVVEKFIGDAVMAVWGTPVAHEDDAERAVRAGLELVEAVREVGRAAAGADLDARVGVVTGEAAVTVGATAQGMVAGDIVNTASRLQSVASPGSVLVADATRQATESAIAYEPAGEQILRGKVAPVPAHRALRVVGRVGGFGRREQLEAPFVGRQAELRVLKELVQAVGEERRPRVVTVIGQAGIGKSRLSWELMKYLDGVTDVVYWWHHGRCPAYGEGMSFWALSEMVRGRAGIAEGDGPEAGTPKLRAMLEEFVPDADERRWIEPPLRELLGYETDAGVDSVRETVFAAWRTLFERISARGTVVLVFEDLQWADAGLLDFIEHVHQWSRDRPIFILTLARPELLDRRAEWGAGWRNATSLTLEPLGTEPMRELLSGLVPGLPDAVTERILRRAEGIPLYAVETVRMLLAAGRIEPSDGVYRLTDDVADLAVPDSLHALVAARLDALGKEAREVVSAASVLGKTFSLEGLSDVAGRPAEELQPVLLDLVRRVLLTVESDPRSPDKGQYGFVQSLVREVAYGTLGRSDRRRLHLAAARHYETQGDDELAGVLATHYLDAYRARPEGPDGEAVAAQARVALRAAAERATGLGSYEQAYGHLTQALEVARTDEERAELTFRAGLAAVYATRYEPGHALLNDAVERYRATGDRPGELRATVWLAKALVMAGEIPAGEALLLPATERFADLKESVEHLELTEMVARIHMRAGRSPQAIEWCDRGLGSPAAEREPRLALEILVTRGTVLGALGRGIEAMATLRGALAVAHDHGLTEVQVRTYINIGFVAATDDRRAAFDASQQGLELSLRLGLAPYLPYLVGNVAEAARPLGEWDALESIAARALELDLGLEVSTHIAASLAGIRAARGEQYQELIDQVRVHRAVDDPQHVAGIESGLGEIALAEGRYDEAIERGVRSIQTFNEAVTPDGQLVVGRAGLWSCDADPVIEALSLFHARTGRVVDVARRELEAGRAALDGRAEDARRIYAEVLREHEAQGTIFEQALCEIGMVAVLPAQWREVAAAAADAREILVRLRAAPYLDRLEEMAARARVSQGTSESAEMSQVARGASASRT